MLGKVTEGWVPVLVPLLAALLLLGLAPYSNLSGWSVEIASTVLRLPEYPAVAARNVAGETLVWVSGMNDLRTQLEELRKENALLRARGLPAPEKVSDGGQGLLEARVDLRPPSRWWEEVRVDRGSGDGVSEGAPALQRGYLVGRISRVFPSHAWVRLVTSPELMVPVVVDETRDLGVAAGDGQGRVVLRHVPFETELRPGDTLSTALVGDDLPPGLPLGEISEIVEGGGFREYVVKTGAELSRLYGVYILVEGGASR